MTIATIALDPSAATPLHRQLYEGLRQAILAGRLPAGMRLPSTRALAHDLAISRNTVLDAYAQLLAEGYLVGKVGSGTYVARALPEELLHVYGPDGRPGLKNGDRAETRPVGQRELEGLHIGGDHKGAVERHRHDKEADDEGILAVPHGVYLLRTQLRVNLVTEESFATAWDAASIRWQNLSASPPLNIRSLAAARDSSSSFLYQVSNR